MRTPQRSRAVLGTVIGLTTLALHACSDADPTGSDVEGRNEASGDPVKVGYINQEQSPTGSFPALTVATEAALNYVNKDLGGANGHPIEWVTCIVDGSPESAQKCGNEMVQEDVVAVLNGINFSGPSAYEVIHSAGIPYVTAFPIQGTDFEGDDVFAILGASPAQFTGEAKFLIDQGVEKVAVMINDTPSGQAGADILVKELAEGGVTDVTMIKESPTATDFTGAVTQAAKGDPDAIAVLFVDPTCGQIVQTARSLGVDARMVLNSSCYSPAVVSAIGDAEDVNFIQELLPADIYGDDPQVKAYVESMKRFAGVDEAELSTLHSSGFAAAVQLADVIGRSGDKPTAESVIATLKDPAGGKGFMDSDWVCDGSALKDYPTVCNASIRVTTIEDGKPVEVTSDWIS